VGIGVDLKDFSAWQLKIRLEQLVPSMLIIKDKIQAITDVTKTGVTKFVLVDLFLLLKIQLKIHHQKNVMKLIVMIIEVIKIIQFLVQHARNGQLKHHKSILELQNNIQILVLVTITIAEILMVMTEFGVILQTQILDTNVVIL
jgi:hypothetical protein